MVLLVAYAFYYRNAALVATRMTGCRPGGLYLGHVRQGGVTPCMARRSSWHASPRTASGVLLSGTILWAIEETAFLLLLLLLLSLVLILLLLCLLLPRLVLPPPLLLLHTHTHTHA